MSASVVQSAPPPGTGTGAGTVVTALGAPVSTANTILALVADTAYPILGTPTDNAPGAGNTYHYVDGTIENTGSVSCASSLFGAYNVAGRSGFTVTEANIDYCCCGFVPGANGALIVCEIAGLTTTNPADRAAVNSGGVSTSSMPTGTTVATLQAEELLAAWVLCQVAPGVTVNPPSGFSGMVRVNVTSLAGTPFALALAFRTVSAIGAYGATWTTSFPAPLFTAGIATFRAATVPLKPAAGFLRPPPAPVKRAGALHLGMELRGQGRVSGLSDEEVLALLSG